MYENFFGLRTAPFHVTPDPALLYLTKGHQEALGAIVYGILGRKGFVTVTGEVGVGKTTVLRHALDQLPTGKAEIVYIFQPALTPRELFAALRRELAEGAAPLAEETPLDRIIADLHQRLLALYDAGKTVVVAIDEAQNMPPETLESLRMLSNLETTTEKLLQIVLVGQPELDALLARHELRQLEQRIAVRARIPLLSRRESRRYVAHRLGLAAGRPVDLFSRPALRLLLRRAGGNPRRLNILCDNALMNAYGHQSPRVSWRIAREAASPLGLHGVAPRRRRGLVLGATAATAAVALAAIALSTGETPVDRALAVASETPAAVPATAPPLLPAPLESAAPTAAPVAVAASPDPAPAADTVPPAAEQEVAMVPPAPPQPAASVEPAPEPSIPEAAAPSIPEAAAEPVPEAAEPPSPAEAPPATAAPPPPLPQPAEKPRPSSLVRTIAEGDTAMRLCSEIYGRQCGAAQLRALGRANPRIANLSYLTPGQKLVFPADLVDAR